MKRFKSWSMSQVNRKKIELNFELWPRQMEAFTSPATERLYGGAAGGGKSHLERVESIALCLDIPGLQYYLFRRNFADLVKSYIEGPSGYRAMLSPLISEGQADSVAKEIRFPNGSKIYLCHCQHEKDVFGFGSFEFHVLNIAEGGEFTPFMIKYLRSRVRISEEFLSKLPKRYVLPKEYWRSEAKPEYKLPKISITCNPIGPGKLELKRMFLEGRKPGQIWRAPDDEGGMLRQFIPAKLGDNPSLNPSEYASKLQGIGSKAYVDALLEGSWDSTIGAYFPEFNPKIHVIKPFPIPDHWTRFAALDWGACGEGDPFCIGWFCVASENGAKFSRDDVICYREWHGRGLPKTTVLAVAEGMHKREEKDPAMLYRTAGGDIKQDRGTGPTIREIFTQENIFFRAADMRRVHGWQQVRERLVGRKGRPALYFFEQCEGCIECLQTLQHDPFDPNDCIQAHDDPADMIRYAVMSRPYATDVPEILTTEKVNQIWKREKAPTLNELWERAEDEQKGRKD